MNSKKLLAICLFPLLLASQCVIAQNINGFVIYVNHAQNASITFHSAVDGYGFLEKNYPYSISTLGSRVLFLETSKKDVKEQYNLKVTEGGRVHRFIILYKEYIEPQDRDKDYSDLKQLADSVKAFANKPSTQNNQQVANTENNQSLTNKQANTQANTQANIPPPKDEKVSVTPQQTVDSTNMYVLIGIADKALKNQQLDEAQKDYELVLQIDPENDYSKAKLAEVKKQIENRESAKYDLAIGSANKAFAANNLDEALRYYTEALAIKRNDTYASGQIQVVKQKIEDAKARAERQKKDSAFNSYVFAGDKFVNGKSYDLAKMEYREALKVRPNDPTTIQKLRSIDDKIVKDSLEEDRRSKDSLYISYLRVADKAVEEKLYEKARNTYNEALKVKPNDVSVASYINTRLRLMEQKITEDSIQAKRQETENLYTGYVALADQALKEQAYDVARNNYNDALQVKPGDAYATGQIKRINIALAELQKQHERDLALQKNEQQEAEYKAIISLAEQYYNAGLYQEAKDQYNKALALNQTDVYVKNKMLQINKTLAINREKQRQDSMYMDAISRADKAFDKQDYPGAKLSYTSALKYRADDLHAKSRLSDIEKALADDAANRQAEKDSILKEREATKKYTALLASAKAAYMKSDYMTARVMYATAAELKPAEQEPQKMVEEIDRTLAEIGRTKEQDNTRDSLISAADLALASQRLEVAKGNYEAASNLNPSPDQAGYLQKQIKYITEQQATAAARAQEQKEVEKRTTTENLYAVYIKSGDEAFKQKSFDSAKEYYHAALQIKPDDSYAAAQIEKIESSTHKIIAVEKDSVVATGNVATEDASPEDVKVARQIQAGMILIKAYLFKMGTDVGLNDEAPIHTVKLDSFYIGKYEITQSQWQGIMGTNPSGFKNCPNCPVENVSWDEAIKFVEKVNELTHKNYRLPTEAEWEFVAGSQSRSEKIKNIAWYDENAKHVTHPVGVLKPNFFGVYDMFGNVAEWCNDWYDASAYRQTDKANPKGPAKGKEKVVRGGSWYDLDGAFRNTYRDKEPATKTSNKIGIRLAADIN